MSSPGTKRAPSIEALTVSIPRQASETPKTTGYDTSDSKGAYPMSDYVINMDYYGTPHSELCRLANKAFWEVLFPNFDFSVEPVGSKRHTNQKENTDGQC